MRRLLGLAFLLSSHLVSSASEPAPGTPGYVMAWNRSAGDSVVDLAPGVDGFRIEFTGRLIAAERGPAAGVRVYVYHADQRGWYGTAKDPELPIIAGTVRSGPGGGFVVRSTMPGMYEGAPHFHFEAEVPPRGRCVWTVNLYPDSASYPLPGVVDVKPKHSASLEFQAIVHLDRDGIYRARKTLHLETWTAAPDLDSLHAVSARKYERAPWRSGGSAVRR